MLRLMSGGGRFLPPFLSNDQVESSRVELLQDHATCGGGGGEVNGVVGIILRKKKICQNKFHG